MKIVVLDGYTVVQDDLSWDKLGRFGELQCFDRTDNHMILSRIKDADMVITSKCRLDRKIINNAHKLKYIGVIATGYNNIDTDCAKEYGITVTNIPAYSTDSVAQFTFSLILEVANHVGLHDSSVHSGEWVKSRDFSYTLSPQIELADKTLGILGYGNIGKKVAQIAESFGMKTLFCSSHMKDSPNPDGVTFVEFEDLLVISDIISLHTALNDNNREMINEKTLTMMKKSAIFVNTSRGPLVNETDLARALNTGVIQAAALDVLSLEPPKEENPLLEAKNCIITPHIAWNTKEARSRLIDIATDNIDSFLNGVHLNVI